MMKRVFTHGLALVFGVLSVLFVFMMVPQAPSVDPYENIYLGRPFPSDALLITSAGQSSDVYIVQSAINNLRIHHLFMPQADESDLQGVTSMVVVLGQSDVGYRLATMSQSEEQARLERLMTKAKEADIAVMLIYLGGKERMTSETKALYNRLKNHVTHMIATPWSKATTTDQYDYSVSWIKSAQTLEDMLATVLR